MILKKNLSEQIYEKIKADILAQRIGFGEKLTNRDLQRTFQVSSTPIRDAINRLYLDGLLEDISNGGARVIAFDLKMALEVNEMMALLNRDAVALTAERGNQAKVIARLEGIVAQQSRQVEQAAYRRHQSLDKQFHRTFFDYSGNARLVRAYDDNIVLWDTHIAIYFKDYRSIWTRTVEQHRQILSAYQAGDYQMAQELMAAHFLEAVIPLKELLSQEDAAPAAD